MVKMSLLSKRMVSILSQLYLLPVLAVERSSAGWAGEALPSPLVDALLVVDVAAGSRSGFSLRNIQQAYHAILGVIL